MRSFRLTGLDPAPFAPLFALDDAALRALGARRVRATSDFGFPCRVSLEDAAAGEELLLVSFEHQPGPGPYRASGPVFVRRDARPSSLAAGVVPPCVTRRTLSLRAYDADHMMVDAAIVDGGDVGRRLPLMLAAPAVRYVHLHNAQRGCYSCTALPVEPAG